MRTGESKPCKFLAFPCETLDFGGSPQGMESNYSIKEQGGSKHQDWRGAEERAAIG